MKITNANTLTVIERTEIDGNKLYLLGGLDFQVIIDHCFGSHAYLDLISKSLIIRNILYQFLTREHSLSSVCN
jgi:hypothetical protein